MYQISGTMMKMTMIMITMIIVILTLEVTRSATDRFHNARSSGNVNNT